MKGKSGGKPSRGGRRCDKVRERDRMRKLALQGIGHGPDGGKKSIDRSSDRMGDMLMAGYHIPR